MNLNRYLNAAPFIPRHPVDAMIKARTTSVLQLRMITYGHEENKEVLLKKDLISTRSVTNNLSASVDPLTTITSGKVFGTSRLMISFQTLYLSIS